MSFKPEDYDIPSHYKHWVGDKAEDYIGPFFLRQMEKPPVLPFVFRNIIAMPMILFMGEY